MSAPGPNKRPRTGGSSLATVPCSTTEENLNGQSDFEKWDGPDFEYTSTSLNPWTTIPIGLALINYATSTSKGWIVYEPGSTWFQKLVKVLYLFFCMIIVVLQITTRVMFKLWLTVCEPWQTNTSLCICHICIFLYPFFRYAFLTIIIFYVTTCPKFELWLTACEPRQTNTPQHA